VIGATLAARRVGARVYAPLSCTRSVMLKSSSSVVQRALRASSTRKATTQAAATAQITALPNGLRVATESTPGHFAALGLYVDAGSRYETAATSGVSHFLDRMAFKVCTLDSRVCARLTLSS
jgi:hypothetical protein